ncbi:MULTISPECIES: DUF397 domain-containing protein [Streptomyces]|uniref:DUF397 domain-containing protein n=1 Tax=Streptomyces tsukubensis (strain DSM 42081 / NBRC 108919 / NRRL 18488 / 9993) TaxID=1114943 RepID=I2N2E0_STRT9|nr:MULTISPECIES: DUF397 domain-containing protein [Streptomyces]AZK95299.1 DUF397 domain-containing protein [Streptomyces tsukubensis]EIF91187.1 hypothetical protein [Streptomyces tsukubensis NRRL18488]MYS62956.1 DUF397 domain-containing protein [Streptomyces sp. SID5473]QKM68646.1 DUF397 domain-containing protein [Streptomyces tsukubensis NRRL18488]TAI43454.1 DUF397 domain-containing protein [Streptomyces tsukubensis]
MNQSRSSITWHKSSYSTNGGNCIEFGKGFPPAVPVRDSKRPDGPVIMFSPSAWSGLVEMARSANL